MRARVSGLPRVKGAPCTFGEVYGVRKRAADGSCNLRGRDVEREAVARDRAFRRVLDPTRGVSARAHGRGTWARTSRSHLCLKCWYV